MVVVIDPQAAGISGDMLLCALVDLGADRSRIVSGVGTAAQHLPGSTVTRLDFARQKRRGMGATCIVLDVEDGESERHGTRIRRCVEEALPEIGLSDGAGAYALSCVDTLITAESRIHDEPADSVHLHEASSVDTVVDILGCAIALDDLGILGADDGGKAEEVVCTPAAVGGGTVDFSHGTVSNPAPAVLEILRDSGIGMRGGGVARELTTPTGACLLANLAESCTEFYPPMRIRAVGYGGGANDFESVPNVLRIVRGDRIGGTGIGTGNAATPYESDQVTVLETNMDDVSGEVVGHVIERMMATGALDVTVSPAITKKNRPSHLVTVMCTDDAVCALAGILTGHVGTLGVRIRRSDRLTLPRAVEPRRVCIRGTDFEVRIKVDPAARRLYKIEFDDVRTVADSLGVPLRDAEFLIRSAVGEKGGAGM